MVPHTLLALWASVVAPSHAMDALAPLGTELGRPDKPLTVMGFIQPQLDVMTGDPVTGLQADGLQPYNGEQAIFNTVSGGGSTSFRVFRARLGARGSIPNTDQNVSYFMLLEAGEVALTRASPIVLSDASVTFSYIPGARIRAGQFKLPIMEEIVVPVAASLEFVHFSNTLLKLMGENPIKDGAYTGGMAGFRDVGVQVFDGFQTDGGFAGSYALMVSNGNGIHSGDNDDNKDISGRLELAWVTDGERQDLYRNEVKVGGWHLQGKRTVDAGSNKEHEVDRMRQGVFLHVEQDVAWGLVEAARGRGMLETGFAPPFPGSAATIAEDGEGWGIVGQVGARFEPNEKVGRIGVKVRYDEYHQQTESEDDLRIFRTTTFGIEHNPVKKVRLQANYELRRLEAPNGEGDVLTLTEAMGDRVTVQATARF